MATREGTRASAEFMVLSMTPDICKSPTIPVPYAILAFFDCAVNFSTNVNFRKQKAFHHKSRLSTVLGNETGVGGGVISGVNKGYCRPIDGTSSTSVRVNGSFVDYHEGTYMFMNCAGPEGPWNTVGKVFFLGNMLPGPVAPSGKVPKSCICGTSDILTKLEDSVGSVDDLVKKGKMLYGLAKTDWSNPAAVLGAMGGLAAIGGLQDVAALAQKAKGLYDTGKKLIDTDWSDPKQALAALAGAGNIPGMSDVSKIAGLASKIQGIATSDWSNPQAALASATNIMKSTGLNQMAAQMLGNAILEEKIPVSQNGTAPPFFPKPGSASNTGSNPVANPSNTCNPIPPSSDGRPRECITPDVLDYLQLTNPAAYERINNLSANDRANAFVEIGPESQDSSGSDRSANDRTAVYIPGEGFSTSQVERDSLPNVSQYIPGRVRELFVAGKDTPSVGNFFGIKEKEGNVYLFGGLVDLGSPELPGAGTAWAWWVPDRILNADMSPYYDYHDKQYYGDNVDLGDIGKILSHEVEAFKAGATTSPLQLPLQAIYSAVTTGVGIFTAAKNSLGDISQGKFDSLSDFYGSVFGESPSSNSAQPSSIIAGGCMGDILPGAVGSESDPNLVMNIVEGGCVDPTAPTLPGQSAPGTGSGAPGTGAPPKPGTAGAPDSNASGAGKDGMLVTTAQGNPSARGAAALSAIRKENAEALKKAQDEEKARQDKVAAEKAAAEKAATEIAAEKKSAQEKEEKGKATGDNGPPDSNGMCYSKPDLDPTDKYTPAYPNRPQYQPDRWNQDDIRESNNCYSYAANDPDGRPYGKPQPGEASGAPTRDANCLPVLDAAAKDGMPPMCIDPNSPPEGMYPVALVHGTDIQGQQDYHWYRQNPDGTWSHKPGSTAVTNLDESGNQILDPASADRDGTGKGGVNYDEFCGYFPMPKDGIQTGSKKP